MFHTRHGILALLCACGAPSSTPDAMPDAKVQPPKADADLPDAMLPPPPPPPTHFAPDAVTFGVVANGVAEGFNRAQALTAGTRHWVTLDLDDDGKLDLVHTGDTAVADKIWDAAGTPYWKVFRGTGGAWGPTPISWTVPTSGQANGFFTPDYDSGSYQWRCLDVDGDGRLDLVHTIDPATGKVWDFSGTPHWKVFRGTAGGFATTATVWPVPPSGTATGFHTARYNSGLVHWTTLDLTGDGRVDLVQTSDPVTGTVWDLGGSPHWKVFAGSDAGFVTTALLWSVPASGTVNGFYVADASAGGERWSLVDLDGDQHLDLVQTADPVTSAVWAASTAPYWKVALGGAGGFAAPVQWAVPPSGLSDGFYRLEADTTSRHWDLLDMNADGRLDLVQTGDVAHTSRVWDADGAPYWKVFANTGTRFSTDLQRWNVPKPGTPGGFYAASVDTGNLAWFVDDVDGDGKVDLVHTMDPATSTVWDATGTPYWKVFRAVQ